ncbi:MAG: hypothetical protein J7577_13370 [Sphingobacteriaceae bacterium]|nr:hypothetical protein [Sphingobacteriaceae bacterium]
MMIQGFKTKTGKFAAVKIPIDAQDYFVEYDEIQFTSKSNWNQYQTIGPGNWSLIGRLTELTEIQIKELDLPVVILSLDPEELWLILIKI